MYSRESAFAVIVAAVLAGTLQVAIAQQNSTTIAPTTSEAKRFLTVEKPMLGFKISYPSDWNITDKDFIISFKAPNNTALVTLSITNLSSYSKANFSLEQYSLDEINTIKSAQSKRVGNLFKLI